LLQPAIPVVIAISCFQRLLRYDLHVVSTCLRMTASEPIPRTVLLRAVPAAGSSPLLLIQHLQGDVSFSN
jgi:hypothetical protein